MVAVWACKLTKLFRPPLRLDDLVRGRLRPAEPPTRALNEVSFEIGEGEIVGLLGPNGAGKTTLLKTLATLVVPDGGEALIAGRPISDEDGVRRSIGLVTSEERSFYWRLTGKENLNFFAAMHGLDHRGFAGRLRRISTLLHLDEFLDRRFDAYSTGMKQRLALGRALLHRPPVLLLDEPTRSVDPVESLKIRSVIADWVQEEGAAVLLVTHSLREAETLCRRILVMRAGELVFDGTLRDLRERTGGPGCFWLSLDRPVDGWQTAPGVAAGELRVDRGQAELRIELAPGHSIGDVISVLHARGARIEDIRSEADPLERGLARIESDGGAVLPPPSPAMEREATPARPAKRLTQIAAFLRRDLRVFLSYRFAFAVGAFGILFNVAVFFYLSKLVPQSRIPGLQRYGADFFPFILIGIAFRGYLGVALLQFANALRTEQMMGTLEMLLASPLQVSTLLAASTGLTFLYHTVTVGGYLVLGVLMGSLSLDTMNLPVAALVMIPTVASFAALGMLSAAFQMTFKRGDPINFFINAASTLFGGVLFPVDVLPVALQWISRALPITYCLAAMRKALLAGAGLRLVGEELAVLAAFALVLVPVALAAFAVAVRQARRDGTLGQF